MLCVCPLTNGADCYYNRRLCFWREYRAPTPRFDYEHSPGTPTGKEPTENPMAIYPSPDKLDEQESKFALVILAAKRARQVKDGARRLTDSKSTNPLTVGLEEIAAGAIIARQVDDPTVTAYRDALRPNEPTLEDIIGAGPVLAIESESDSASQLAALRRAGSDDDDLGDNDDEDEVRPVDAFALDSSGLMMDPDEDDEEDSPPGMDEEDE